jgi:hypothetical protein
MQTLEKMGYSKKEAAIATSLSVRSIDYLLARRILHGVKVGKRVIVSAKSLQKLVEKGVTGAYAEAGTSNS